MNVRYSIEVYGIVQGVGFRPFIHRQARKHNLTGWCRNSGIGVEMEAQGSEDDLNVFISDLRNPDVLPPLAVVNNVKVSQMAIKKEETFVIIESKASGHDTLIAPDLATCPDCLKELKNPGNFRYHYPFINCTNCGPRFTIVKDVPYDRPLTSMKKFKMCPVCDREYHDIENRRYHAQPVCCPECGPKLVLCDDKGNKVKCDPIDEARRLLSEGKIIAIKGLGGFHLACQIDETHVSILRQRKHRNGKPFALMVKDLDAAKKLVHVSKREEEVLCGNRRPIVLLNKKNPDDYYWISKSHTIGIMLPYTPIHYMLLDTDLYDSLIMTSANLSDEPVIYRNDEAYEKLKGIADYFLIHDRDIVRRCDDSLIQLNDQHLLFYRRSRGYTPSPISIQLNVDGLLALGGEQKASFAFGKKKNVFYSQHIGDLKNIETYEFYQTQITDFKRLFNLKPEMLISDLHPDYLSTRYAMDSGLPYMQVQHHHAHMASCMADNGLNEKCIGLIFDGTGFGLDHSIWGSEVLVGDYADFRRFAYLKPIELIGGDKVTEEIDRVAFVLAYHSGYSIKNEAYEWMLEKHVNCPLSSGLGRYFDGVYSLITNEKMSTYEGEAAILLESMARSSHTEEAYEGKWINDQYDYRPMIRSLLKDNENGMEADIMARKFHNAIINYAVEACLKAREFYKVNKVVCSGGCFMNELLTAGIREHLEANGFEVYLHHQVSCSDEGIALGQLAIGQAKMKGEKTCV